LAVPVPSLDKEGGMMLMIVAVTQCR